MLAENFLLWKRVNDGPFLSRHLSIRKTADVSEAYLGLRSTRREAESKDGDY